MFVYYYDRHSSHNLRNGSLLVSERRGVEMEGVGDSLIEPPGPEFRSEIQAQQ
jgi:hypothetical protein